MQHRGYFWVGAAPPRAVVFGACQPRPGQLQPACPADGGAFTLAVPQPRSASQQGSWLCELSPEYRSYFIPTASPVSVT